MPKIIDGLVEYMLAARSAKLPPEVIQKGKSHLLDSLAAIVSGSTLKPGKLGLEHARALGGKEECSVLSSNLQTTPILAAFANGMSGHADETDDSNSQLHPGCAIVPAALAIAESQNRSGEGLLRAVILGYDIGFRFHQAFQPRSTRPENPMNPEEVEKKAAWLMEPVLGKRNVDGIFESIRQIETIGSARELTKLMMVA